jgi:hypothetical protein
MNQYEMLLKANRKLQADIKVLQEAYEQEVKNAHRLTGEVNSLNKKVATLVEQTAGFTFKEQMILTIWPMLFEHFVKDTGISTTSAKNRALNIIQDLESNRFSSHGESII